jgi:hypothetical protein
VSATGRSLETELLIALVERSAGSGVFAPDERLRVEGVTLGVDERINTADFSVRLDASFDTVAARETYSPDLRVAVRTVESDASKSVVLFDGYPPIQQATLDGGPRGAEERYTFEAVAVYDILARGAEHWIYGRRMRSGEILDGLASDPTAWSDKSVLVEATPCVFNPDGAANCSPTPLSVVDADGVARSIHIFTHDDPDGIPWTYLNALRYLVWFYGSRFGPVLDGSVFSATEAFVAASIGDGSRLIERLLAPCDSLGVEAVNLVEALALLSESSGVHVSVEPALVGEGIRSSFRLWAAGDGVKRTLALAPGGTHADGTPKFDARSLAPADVLRANEVTQARLTWDYRRIVNAPVVVGGVKAYEMTVPLAPGWEPVENLDNVAAENRDEAKEIALTPEQVALLGAAVEGSPWYQQYHADGSQFAENAFVGRLWVLNEDGRFDGATYNRNAPFDDYQPFDFSTVTEGGIARRGAWSRRSRALLPTITTTPTGARFGVFVEISFDSGVTWLRATGPVDITRDPTGVCFKTANPTQITPPGVDPLDQNMWYAIIDQTFRVRVTAVIEGDERLTGRFGPDDATPTLLRTSEIDYRPRDFAKVTRLGTNNILASVNPGGPGIEIDDASEIDRVALESALRGRDRRIEASPVVPRLDTSFAIGDEIELIGARGVSLVARSLEHARGPIVVGKRYRFDNGRWETALELAHDE